MKSDTEAIDGRGHVVSGVRCVTFIQVLKPFVKDALCDVARYL